MARTSAPRNWQLDADPFAVEEIEDLHAAIVEATQILSRIGGAIVIVADREQEGEHEDDRQSEPDDQRRAAASRVVRRQLGRARHSHGRWLGRLR